MTSTRATFGRIALIGTLGISTLIACSSGSDASTAEPPASPESTTNAESAPPSSDVESPDSGETRMFEADNGTIEIPTDPQRIVFSGDPSIPLRLGVEPIGVDVIDESFLEWITPEQKAVYEAATRVGSGEINYEQMASLNPDLIVVVDPPFAWEEKDEDRLQSIAPTVFIAIDLVDWKGQGERIADALGALDAFEDDEAAYEELVAEIKDEYADILDATTFAFVNRWEGTNEGSFAREYGDAYCTGYVQDVGINLPGGPEVEWDVSMERLGELAEVDVILYAAGPDGESWPALEPVVESNVWNALPQVADGRALAVKCNIELTYAANITNLESLQAALGTLAPNE